MRNPMLNLLAISVVVGLAISPMPIWAKGDGPNLKQLAVDAVSEKPQLAQAATAMLRDAGPAGLQALEEVHRYWIDKQHNNPGSIDSDPTWRRVKAALDAVGAQRDCHTSRLYWYTDFEAAKAAAKKAGKPILSLRLMGKLTDEFSCANSRFFRSTLYANEEVSQVLRDNFILHWQSVRPVPKVTIDFGDGRKLERTLTGNSIHYILDSDGRPIDALPGLYGPKAFLRGLEQAQGVVAAVRSLNNEARSAYLQKYHLQQADLIRTNWQQDLQQLGLPAPVADPSDLITKTDDSVWGRIAELHADDAQLDDASVALIRSQNPSAARAAPLTASKAMVENPMLRIVRNFQNTIAIDTVRNEYTMHREIHEWFASGVPVTQEVNSLNEAVYAQLFLTPSSDPWLGLAPGDVYTALDHGGMTQN